MGLDMYAYVADKPNDDSDNHQQISYWRKHPNLHGWMTRLWKNKSSGTDDEVFNGIELELTWEDITRLEKDIKSGEVSRLGTTGFFFGRASDDEYREHDLQFCATAKAELFLKRRVFYNSSW